MPADMNGGPGLAVVAGDVLALRGTGLAAAETWALLCQAAQALQDLFLSNGGVVGGSRAGPVVTPHTLELTPRGRVLLQLAPPETARAYLPPEYRPGRVYSDTDSEKMWMYSLGRALLDTTPRVAALTGTVSVSPSSALQSVLAAMTEPDPRRRASLMNLLDVISEYCRTRLQSKPFTHIVMDMYREVVKSSQYAARKRAYIHLNSGQAVRNPVERTQTINHQNIYSHQHQHHYQHHRRHVPQQQQMDPLHNQANIQQQERIHNLNSQYNHLRQDNVQRSTSQYHLQQHAQQGQTEVAQQAPIPRIHTHHPHHHPTKGALFKLQSRNSHSYPNLPSLCGQQQKSASHQESEGNYCRKQTNQRDGQTYARTLGPAMQHHRRHQHARTHSQPNNTRLHHTRSSGNLASATAESTATGNIYSDPIYAIPVKPFLSSQDVRVNGLSAKSAANCRNEEVYGAVNVTRHPSQGGHSQPNIAATSGEQVGQNLYGRTNVALQRQHSNPQLPSRRETSSDDFNRQIGLDDALNGNSQRCNSTRRKDEQIVQQQNPVSSMRARILQGPPKPPRIITTLRKTPYCNAESSKSEPPVKPPRNLVKNGPRARRGKAVQRAPSRLYRTVGGRMRSFNKAQCVGPEFVVRANQPPKTLCVGQIKSGNSGRIVVIMLTGQRVEVTCDPHKVTAGDLFQAIVQAENLEENFTLGLAVLVAGDFAILPPDTKLNKVAPPGWLNSGKSKGLLGLPTSFMLYLRLRFFLPSLRGVRSWISKHLLYLQIRRCILEQQLVCPYSELINLTGLALQAEFGNYNVNEHGCGDYFLLEHYIPESLILNIDQNQAKAKENSSESLRGRLHQAHRDRRGLDSNKAEEMFITHAQSLPDYGSHYYIATVDAKDLEKVMVHQRKREGDNCDTCDSLIDDGDDIYGQKKPEYGLYGKIGITRLDSCENIPRIQYEEQKLTKSATSIEIYRQKSSKSMSCGLESCNNNSINKHNDINNSKSGKGTKKKSESNVWLAIHAQGLKIFERGGEPRERIELARFQWKDIQTLSYSKSCLVVYSKLNGKRCKFKLRMDHRKSYFAFKLTSLHHQFFLRLRSELTSLQGLAKEFGVPMTSETKNSPSKAKGHDSKTKITIASTVKTEQQQQRPMYPMQLEEYQNKENENPEREANATAKVKEAAREPGFYSSEEDALYAQVNVRLEPEGESRDTEDESERSLGTFNEPLSLGAKGIKTDHETFYNCPRIEVQTEVESAYTIPKMMAPSEEKQVEKPDNPEELYAAINKVSANKNNEFPVPDEVWDVADVKKSLHKMKTSSLPNYGTSRQTGGFRTPSLPRRLGVKMGTRAIYSSLVQKDATLTDDMESMSLKSDTESSIQSLSARSAESPLPEAYVLNADIRTDDETFHVTEDESMSASLVARLEELSFAEERILQTIKLERGHGGSIGLQVTEGNDGGVYVQAVSVGGSADMAGNVNKGDRIVAINGQSLLHLSYEEALKMLQSSSDTIELVLSQAASHKAVDIPQSHEQRIVESNYLHDIRFDISSEGDSSCMTHKWLAQRTADVASVQNTSSAYSSAASSAMGNHNANNIYMSDHFIDGDTLKSASAEPTSTPPIPPRRKKRKLKPPPQSTGFNSETVTVEVKKSEKRVAPPPPPQPPQASRRRKSRTAKTVLPEPTTSDSLASSNPQKHQNDINNSSIAELNPESLQSIDTNTVEHQEIENNNNNEETETSERLSNQCPLERSLPPYGSTRKKETNKYPPLFFTLHDFENVISDLAPCSTEKEEEEQQKPDALPSINSEKKSRDFSSNDSFFNENSLEDEEEGEVFFRVTTTNVPFERCSGRWNGAFMGQDFVHMIDDSNSFVFEDYIDRSSRLNIRKSLGPMCYDVQEQEEQPTLTHAATKVRFVIESPSTTTPESETNDEENELEEGEYNLDKEEPQPAKITSDEEKVKLDLEKTIPTEERVEVHEEPRDIDWSNEEQEETKLNDDFSDVNLSEISEDENPEGIEGIGDKEECPEEKKCSEEIENPNEIENLEESECSEETGDLNELEGSEEPQYSKENEYISSKAASIDISEREIDLVDLDDFGGIPFSTILQDSDGTMWSALDNQTWVSFSCTGFGSSTAVITEITDPHLEEAFLSGKDVESQQDSFSDERESPEGIEIAEIDKSDNEECETAGDVSLAAPNDACETDSSAAMTESDSSVFDSVSDFIASTDQRDTVSRPENDVAVIESDLICLSRKNSEIEETKSEDLADINEKEMKTIEPNLSPITVQDKRKILVSASFHNFLNNEENDSMDIDEENESPGIIDENEEVVADFGEDNNMYAGESSTSATEIEEVPKQMEIKENTDEQENIILPFDKQESDFPVDNIVTETETARKKLVGVPVNIRRNSFLETMLSEEFVNETWSIPTVNTKPLQVATDFVLEQPVEPKRKDNDLANRLNTAIKMDLEIQKILKESNERMEEAEKLEKTSDSIKKRQNKVVDISPRSAGEVKCNVLNELLTNFSSIKLKPANPRSEVREIIVEESIIAKDVNEIRLQDENEEDRNLETNTLHNEATQDNNREDVNTSNLPQEDIEVKNAESDLQASITNIEKKSEESTSQQKDNSLANTVELTQNQIASSSQSNTLFKAKLIMNPEDYSDDYLSLESTEQPEILEEINSEDKSHGRVFHCEKTEAKIQENVTKYHSLERDVSRTEAITEKEGNTTKWERVEAEELHDVARELHERRGSANSCAIVRSPESHCNNNDNNRAATPIAVSNDQILDTVTIIPGSVKSFVKYYEIRREATIETDSRNTDRDELTGNKNLRRSVSSIRRSWELKAKENEMYKQRSTVNIKKSIPQTVETSKRINDGIIKRPETDKDEKEEDRIKGALKEIPGRGHSLRTKQKKSVQFQGGFTVIRSPSFDQDDTIGSQSYSSPEEKSTGEPVLERVVSEARVNFEDTRDESTIESNQCSSAGQETATQIRVTGNCEESSGISRFVPKADTPRLVFYCTV